MTRIATGMRSSPASPRRSTRRRCGPSGSKLYSCPTTCPRVNKLNDYGFDPHEQEHEHLYRHGRRHQRARPMGGGVDGADPGPHQGASGRQRQGHRRLSPAAGARHPRRRRGPPAAADLPPDAASRIHGPASIDAIGPVEGWEAHWRQQDRQRRAAASWNARAGRSCLIARTASPSVTAPGPRSSTTRPRASRPRIRQAGLGVVRLAFVDAHGVLRGKTLVADEAIRVLRSGVNATTTLLMKDLSGKTAFPVFSARWRLGPDPALRGAADMVMLPDPLSFRVLPWAPHTGWLLCDLFLPDGRPMPLSTRALARPAGRAAGRARLDLHRRASRSSATSCRAAAAAAGAGLLLAQPRLPIPDGAPLRRARPGAWNSCARRLQALGPAAAHARGGVRPEPGGAHLRRRRRA